MLNPIMQLLRIKQYSKQVFVLLPLLTLGNSIDFETISKSTLAAMAFSFLASSVYVFNDIRDRVDDSAHPYKRKRPIASGEIKVKSGLLIAMITLTMSFFIVYTVFENSMTLTIIMIVYLTINTVYSFFNLKRLNLVGISLVASGFPLRFAFGTYAIEAEFSYWAVLLSFTLAMFLLSGKRVQQGTDTNSRSIILDYRYSTLLLFGGLFGAEYVSFIADSNNQDFWGNTFFFISPIPVFLMVARYLELVAASRITDDEDITESFMKDLQLFVTAISYAFIMFAARYSS